MIGRALQVCVALIALVLLAPLLLLSIVLIKVFDGPGPVFRQQECVTSSGRRFRAWQFGSVTCHGMRDEPVGANEDASSRPVARWLCRNGFQELPKLFNVVVGDIDLRDLGG